MFITLLSFLTATLVATVASSSDDSLQGDDEDDSISSITFVDTDPELFNQGAQIFATVVSWIYRYAIFAFCGVLMTWHLRCGRYIPASELGYVPHDSFRGLILCWALKSLPAVVLIFFLALGNFSQTVALKGLTFPVVVQEGPNDTTVSFASESAMINVYPNSR